MYVLSPGFVKVGSGMVFRVEGQKLHTRPLGADLVRVCLKEIVPGHEDTPLPCRDVGGEFTTVRHALNTFVAWPINLVSLQKQVSKLNNGNKGKSVAQSKSAVSKSAVSRRKVAYPREGDVDDVIGFHVCKSHAKFSRSSVSFDVEMPETRWGSRFVDHVSLENMREIITRDWLGASTICFYIRYLCDVYLINEDEQQSNTNVAGYTFCFISPHVELERTHLVDILQKHEGLDHLIMIPSRICNNHWVLVAINTKSECIYYLDPLRVHHSHASRAELVRKINNAMNSYRDNKRQMSTRKKLSHNQWVSVECPRQDSTKQFCGFFVCLFIEDILEAGNTSLSLIYPQKHRCNTFVDERITCVQRQWCGYFYNKHFKAHLDSL